MNDTVLSGLIESITLEGEGVARVDGKVYFVDGALPGESVEFEVKRNRRKYGNARLVRITGYPAPQRIESDCEYFGVCGGCSLRHYERDAQLGSKQQVLLDALQRIGKTTPEIVMEPLSGDWLHYRRKARLGIRYVEKKGGALVGFREKNKSFITPLERCLTLTRRISGLLPGLSVLVNQLPVKQRLPQIEVAEGDNGLSLVFRHLEPLSEHDQALIREFANDHQVQAYSQPKGLDSVVPLFPAEPESLYYQIAGHDFRFYFDPTDFIQVNAQANGMLVARTIELLDPQANDRILDLYCGLGNFSLPLARQCAQVFGVEGDQRLVEKARCNANVNGIENTRFQRQDLGDETSDFSWLEQGFDKVLLDPARLGAALMAQKLGELKPGKIVYVSCNPATLARDANILANQYGYKLKLAGIVNMFPHTAHVESIAVFE